MTVITKLSAILKKPKITNSQLIEKNACEEQKIEIRRPTHPSIIFKGIPKSVLYLALLCSVLTILVFTMGLILNQATVMELTDQISRCTILVPNDLRQVRLENLKKIKHEARKQAPSQQLKTVQLISTRDEAASDALADALREDLDIQGSFEKISVITNGRIIDFIHDFEDNTTTIVDKKRCFVMQLKPDWVLPPDDFLAALRRGDAFDVSRETRRLRASPAPAPTAPGAPAPSAPAPARARAPSAVLAACASLPAYWLHPDDGLEVHKRSVEGAAGGAAGEGAEYVHFAGRRVQEIHITNLPELLRREAAQR